MITEEEYRNAAITQYKQGNYEECVNICNGAIKNNIISGSIYNVKSLAAMSLKQYDEALFAIQQAVLLSPQNETYRKNKGKIETIVNRNKKEFDIELPDEDIESPKEKIRQQKYRAKEEKREIPVKKIGLVLGVCLFAGVLFMLFPMIFHGNTHTNQPEVFSQNNPLGNPLQSSGQGFGQPSSGNYQSRNIENGQAGTQNPGKSIQEQQPSFNSQSGIEPNIKIHLGSLKYLNFEGSQSILGTLSVYNIDPYDNTKRDVHPYLEEMEISYALNDQPPVKFPLVELGDDAYDNNDVSVKLPFPHNLLKMGDELFLIVKPKMAQGDVSLVKTNSLTNIYDENPYPQDFTDEGLLFSIEKNHSVLNLNAEERIAYSESIRQKYLQ